MSICKYDKPKLIGAYYPLLCQRPSLASDPDGMCILHSRQIDKDLEAFNEAIIRKVNQQDYNFRGVFFPKDMVLFARQKFHNANFQHAEFTGWTFFERAEFAGDTNFIGVKFDAYVSFVKTIFSRAAIFLGATFSDNVDFSEAEFGDELNLTAVKFSKQATFASINLITGKKRCNPFIGFLRWLKIDSKAEVRFQDLSLARAQFHGTDLRLVEFDRVTWASCWGRAAVYDEVLLHQQRWAYISYLLNYGWLWGKRIPGEIEKDIPKKPTYADFGPVERLCRQLKANYEEERDFKRVGDFHYGEMEMHRRGSPWRQWLPSWYNFYRVLSGYGERPLRAFIWLLLLIPAWAGLVWGLGIDQAGSQTPSNYGDTLLYIFEKATLQRPPWPAGITWLGKFLSSVSVLLLPGQAALFILALRNRLGRRR